jgi:hypothetical protein
VHVTRLAPALAAAAARGGANTVAAHVAWLDGVISIDVADGVLVVEAALSRRPEPIGGFDGLRLLDLLLIGNVPFDGVRMVEERVVVNGSGAVARLRAVVPGGGGSASQSGHCQARQKRLGCACSHAHSASASHDEQMGRNVQQ